MSEEVLILKKFLVRLEPDDYLIWFDTEEDFVKTFNILLKEFGYVDISANSFEEAAELCNSDKVDYNHLYKKSI